MNKVNKTLSNIKSSWEQFLTKFLFDQCEQSEQNPFKISKALGNNFLLNFCVINVNKVNKTLLNIENSWKQFLTKFLCDQCELSEQNHFKY